MAKIRSVVVEGDRQSGYKRVQVLFGTNYFLEIVENQGRVDFLLGAHPTGLKAEATELEGELAETKALANQAMRELLSLARQLRPTALDDLGLAAATAGLVEQLGRGEIEADFAAEGDFSDLPDDAQLVVYRVAQEALSHAARHSGAERISVALRRRGDGGVALKVADGGCGFAFDESEGGLGIAGMRERALLIGGELAIESRPGHGTTVRLTVPG